MQTEYSENIRNQVKSWELAFERKGKKKLWWSKELDMPNLNSMFVPGFGDDRSQYMKSPSN